MRYGRVKEHRKNEENKNPLSYVPYDVTANRFGILEKNFTANRHGIELSALIKSNTRTRVRVHTFVLFFVFFHATGNTILLSEYERLKNECGSHTMEKKRDEQINPGN